MRWEAVVLLLLLFWPLAAFGGRSAIAAITCAVGSILFALFARAWAVPPGTRRNIDGALIGLSFYALLQCVPLPSSVGDALSPMSGQVRRALVLVPPDPHLWLPLTIDARATLWAALVTSGWVAVFLGARAVFSRGGVRQTVRGIAGIGIAVSLLAIAQAATAGRRIYWRFPTEYEGPLPFGPFVNRNHFATWAIMAVPLCLGYAMARASKVAATAGGVSASPRVRLARMADGRTLWLGASAALLIGALLVSLSRSGIFSLAAALLAGAALFRSGRTPNWPPLAVGLVVLVIGIGVSRASLPAVASRFTQAGSSLAKRVTIWKETAPLVRDFRAAGTGAGTYRTAMFYYQRSARLVQFNQAHNHYLQVLAEQGLIGAALAILGVIALVRATFDRLRADASGVDWLRAGAATGLMAAALQSVWETGLVMPANAALAATLAAIAVHHRHLPAPAAASD